MFKKLNKKMVAAGATVAAIATTTMAAFADGTADPIVSAAFTSLKGDVMATLGVVAGLGVAVMGTFLAWKYGRKIFNQVAK